MELTLGGFTLALNLSMQELMLLVFLLLLTVLAYWWMTRIRKERTLKLGNFDTLKEVNNRRSIANPLILVVTALTVTLLFLVATGSIQILHQQKASSTEIVLAVDNTFSMDTPDYDPTRMRMTKQRAEDWIRSLPDNSEVAVVSFSREARSVTTLTDNREQLLTALGSIDPDLSSSGTAIGDAVQLSVEMLSESPDKKEIVLVTDGVNNAGINLSESVNLAKEENVSVNIIGISSTDRTENLYEKLSEQLNLTDLSTSIPSIDEGSLSEAAGGTGGEFYSIENASGLSDSLKNTSLKEERIEPNSDHYFTILIALILITGILLYSRYGAIKIL